MLSRLQDVQDSKGSPTRAGGPKSGLGDPQAYLPPALHRLMLGTPLGLDRLSWPRGLEGTALTSV